MNQRLRVALGLFTVAAMPRLLGAFFLPNTFGDAYVYIRDIGDLSTKIKTGTFAVTDLYGFWLPLYQFISALLNVFAGNGFYTGKIVAALFGVGVCLLVYAITLQLVEKRIAAFLSFLLIALSPLHILTSTSALTDVPHAFFVLGALYFVLNRRWLVAAIFAALAGLTRVESWMLIALIPALQFWKERRVSIPSLFLMLLPPLFWFWVSWKAVADWLATFKVRQQYHDWLLRQNPALQHFTFAGVIKDSAMFVSGADLAVLIAAFVAGWLVLRNVTGKSHNDTKPGDT
ncbi:MAG TPA: glycosyltransferase family 39 protein, partial [Pyrinomonadaceae bacterium]|nr:glycosyltransferase family 39 protein [Pyrinomonadaceae bacterium]